MKKRAERKELEKQTGVKFKPYEYDSDENEFEARMEAKEQNDESEEEEIEENTYDSEFEAEFFGKADPGVNEEVFGQLEKIQAQNAKEAEQRELDEKQEQKNKSKIEVKAVGGS